MKYVSLSKNKYAALFATLFSALTVVFIFLSTLGLLFRGIFEAFALAGAVTVIQIVQRYLMTYYEYILDPADCLKAIRRVYKTLNPGGIFIFDVNTPEKLRAMDGQVFLDEDDDVYCVWRGEFDERTNICSYGMDLFQRNGETWQRSFEEHQEYAYTVQQLTEYLKAAGFTHIKVYGDGVMTGPQAGEQRIYFSARKGIRK